MNTLTQEFTYRMAGVEGVLDAQSRLWGLPLEPERPSFLLSHFFEAATAFIQQDDYRGLRQGLLFYGRGDTPLSEIASIEICIEKHGAFYHPARVSVTLASGEVLLFVLNTAVSDPGLSVMDSETRVLERLAREVPGVVLPRVFSAGRVASSEEGEAAFFLAQWFEGYLEFHITGSKAPPSLDLWESDGSTIPVEAPAYFDLYGQAAEILTRLYNLETFEQVFPWHHAAGDFVAKPLEKGFDLRLITVRNYDSMIGIAGESGAVDMDGVNRALLMFFFNLCLRMRLDRIDGTKEYCLVDPGVVPHVVDGFFRGLQSKRLGSMAGADLCRGFVDFTREFDRDELLEITEMTVGACNPAAPEVPLIQTHLAAHGEMVVSRLREIGKKSFFIDKAF
ncbi:MAG: hypothetical protein GY737_23500 [Desulfobacteraceae bacterium]|nr:hypothetical protein [Desulfobacteraceae bacterium]